MIYNFSRFKFVCFDRSAAKGEIDIYLDGNLDNLVERFEVSLTGCTSTSERRTRMKEAAHRWMLSKERLGL